MHSRFACLVHSRTIGSFRKSKRPLHMRNVCLHAYRALRCGLQTGHMKPMSGVTRYFKQATVHVYVTRGIRHPAVQSMAV